MNIKKYEFNDFEIDFNHRLGNGTFGNVYKAKEKKTGKFFAIKRILSANYKDEEINNLINMNDCENSINIMDFLKKKI